MEVAHDARMVLGVSHNGRRVEDLDDVRGASDLVQLVLSLQPRGERDAVDALAGLVDLEQRLVDTLVCPREKHLGLGQDMQDAVEPRRVEDDGREHRRLGVQVARWRAPSDAQDRCWLLLTRLHWLPPWPLLGR